MGKGRRPVERYICAQCMTIYEVENNNNGSTPRCLNCGSPLLKTRTRRWNDER